MSIIENNQPDDQVQQEADAKALADNILDHFELPESLAKKIDEADRKNPDEVVEEKEEASDGADEKAEEAGDEVPEETKEEEAEEEELIPKSKFQKRLDEMTREKRMLEARLQRLEQQGQQQQPQKDEDTLRLEKMSESELQSLKKQTRLAQLKNASDDAMVNKLFELEDKIDGVMKQAPQRFMQSQVQQFNEAVAMSASEIPDFQKSQKDVFQLAKRIYETAPELHSSVQGQARAWNLAVQHYKLMQEANMGKTKVAELTREKNTLKKRVSIEGVSRKAASEPDSDAKLFRKAKHGELNDKMEFIRKKLGTDAIVDSFMDGRG